VLSFEQNRTAGHDLLELRKGDDAARERHAADDCRQRDGNQRRQGNLPAGPVQLDRNHQQGGAAAEAVVHRYHLRHRRHPHADGGDPADRRAGRDAGEDRDPADRPALQQGRADGQRHTYHRDHVAPPGRLDGAEHPQPEDEENGRGEVEELNHGGGASAGRV